MDTPWAENVVEITEVYEEGYPTGKRNYEMVKFMLTERKFLYIPEGSNPNEYIAEARKNMHNRLIAAVGNMVAEAVKAGRLVGVNR